MERETRRSAERQQTQQDDNKDKKVSQADYIAYFQLGMAGYTQGSEEDLALNKLAHELREKQERV